VSRRHYTVSSNKESYIDIFYYTYTVLQIWTTQDHQDRNNPSDPRFRREAKTSGARRSVEAHAERSESETKNTSLGIVLGRDPHIYPKLDIRLHV
jgi:hypothetical protein